MRPPRVGMQTLRAWSDGGTTIVAAVALYCLVLQAQPSSCALNFGSLVTRFLQANQNVDYSSGLTANSVSARDYTAPESVRASRTAALATQNPVLFIPGDGGSQLEAKLNRTSRVHYLCDLVADWFDMWLNIHLLLPVAFDCLSDNMKLYYNSTSRTTYNTPGVEIRPTSFGLLDSVEYLDVVRIPDTDYFHTIVASLETVNGYVANENMIGAAYDFRKGPNELGDFFAQLTTLIEDHYVRNNYKPVTLICHSMGCLNSLYLLNGKSDNWKEVYIRRLITLAAPWSGSFKAISAMLYGDNLGIPLLNKNKLQALQSTFPSLMYLFPRAPVFEPDRVLVETPTKNYTLKNLDELFTEAKLPDQRDMWHDTRAIAEKLHAPNVELWCLYGSGVDTPSKIIYSSSFDSNKYLEVQGDGDGTVNLESLRACEDFAKHQAKPVYTRMFEKVDHIDILRGKQAAEFISTFIMSEDWAAEGVAAELH